MTFALSIVQNVKRYRSVAPMLAVLGMAALSAGCGGVKGSHSVSPASFFLPGLIRYEAPKPSLEPGSAPAPIRVEDSEPLPT